MAVLVPCPACGGQVSTAARACPHCGHPLEPNAPAASGEPPEIEEAPAESPSGAKGLCGCLVLVGFVAGLIAFAFFIIRNMGPPPGGANPTGGF